MFADKVEVEPEEEIQAEPEESCDRTYHRTRRGNNGGTGMSNF